MTAINVGDDTDTVAAIAGALLGARWGASAIPADWRRVSHGYPGLKGDRLVELATLAANGGPIIYDWPLTPKIGYEKFAPRGVCVQHPYDGRLMIGDVRALGALPGHIDAVVSLCLVGTEQVPSDRESVVFRLIDNDDPDENVNLDFVLADAVQTIAKLRGEGKSVFLHCVAAQSRTPTVAIAYAMSLGAELSVARQRVLNVLPGAAPNRAFEGALRRLVQGTIAAPARSDFAPERGYAPARLLREAPRYPLPADGPVTVWTMRTPNKEIIGTITFNDAGADFEIVTPTPSMNAQEYGLELIGFLSDLSANETPIKDALAEISSAYAGDYSETQGTWRASPSAPPAAE
ncbi:hypothetical protein Back2_28160 [Nocardioides baekrokdamisoli]|uniref:Tyrosine specific protein phosphatases domain-containing protein n=1 Tax=Nocardioides baekrokdamisoli TaxID=1804624 RepID=A0A3G9J685_9ACTN|nr:ADP-ribosylglycohydrolase family protein [Nocardioides baekrokdamisoli]BBH18529.1 hypothetical protein Back2_28160 [Nocardioides baekrokdamisoli]